MGDPDAVRAGDAAVVVNAVHRATGVRVRHLPVTLDELLTGPP
ncbi:hypothetical protein [Geodermatophilus sp. URMC 65]